MLQLTRDPQGAELFLERATFSRSADRLNRRLAIIGSTLSVL